MSIRSAISFLCFFFGLYLQVSGQGGPPMITDDPGTVEKGHFEINSGITAEHTTSESSFEFPFIDINYGLSKRQHINFEVPLVSLYSNDFDPQRGIGKFGIGTKFRFFDQEDIGVNISTHPALSFVVSKDAVDKGLIDKGTELFIPLEFQKDINKDMFGMELGRLINSRNQGAWTYGMLYAREFNSNLNAAFEINGSSNTAFTETNLFWNLGGRMTITHSITILISGGKSIFQSDGAEDVYIGYLALQLAI